MAPSKSNSVSQFNKSMPPLPRRRVRLNVGWIIVTAIIVVVLVIPTLVFGHAMVAAVYMKNGEQAVQIEHFAEARDNYYAAMEWSANENPYRQYWSAARRIGDIERAVADFSRIIADQPDVPYAYCYRAEAYRQLDNDSAALADYRSCVERHPGETMEKSVQNSIDTLVGRGVR